MELSESVEDLQRLLGQLEEAASGAAEECSTALSARIAAAKWGSQATLAAAEEAFDAALATRLLLDGKREFVRRELVRSGLHSLPEGRLMRTETESAELRIRAALEHIEDAQRELGRAGEQLSPVIGASAEWQRISKLYDRVHAEWHRINLKLERGRWRVALDGSVRRAAGMCAASGCASHALEGSAFCRGHQHLAPDPTASPPLPTH